MYTLIRLREGVKAHGLAGRTAKAIAPYLGKPATAKTMPPAFVPISVAFGDFHPYILAEDLARARVTVV